MAKNTRQKHARNQEYRSFANVSANFSASTARKLSLSALTTVLTAATCLGGQPILASSNILLPPTTAAFASQVSSTDADPTPWLHTPNILEYQRYRYQNSNGDAGYVNTDENHDDYNKGNYDDLKNKTDMYAHVKTIGNDQYLVFDVFFNNDGKSMLTSSKKQQYVWLVPYAVADLNNGAYKGDTVTDLRFDFYKRNGSSPQTYANLSHDIKLFNHEASKSFDQNLFNNDHDYNGSTYKNSLNVRNGGSRGRDISDNFHVNERDLDDAIKKAIAPGPSPYSGYNYGIGITTVNVDYAVRMHCKVKLRQGVTTDDIQNAFTYANTSSYGRNTHSAYTFISGRTHDENFPRTKSDNLPPKLYFNGKELTDDSSSITVYQGDKQKITFGTSDNSEKVTSFSVKGFPDSINGANFEKNTKNNEDGFDATEKNPYKHEIKDVKFENKNGNTPVNSDYTITVSATDASGNTAEKKVTVHLKNLNQKYPSPTAEALTVDWGHKLTEADLTKQIKNNDGQGNNGNGKVTFIESPLPSTNLGDDYYKYPNANKVNVTAKITYTDGSYHLVPIPVTVNKPLSLQHKLNGNTVNATVGEDLKKVSGSNKVDAKEYLGKLDDAAKKKIKSAEWVNDDPTTSVAGKREYTAKVTFSDGSTAEEKVTFTVRPQKPKIETDLTGVAGVKGKEVVVDAGSGAVGSTVTLKDKNGTAIGTGTVGADGKVTITVKDGIPEGKITAVTTTTDSVSSEESDAKNASKDDQKPTLTADTAKVEVEVGKDLTINLTAKDNLKVDRIDTATATMKLFGDDINKMSANKTRAGVKYDSKNTDKEKKLTYTFSGFKLEEIGTYNLTFKAFDSAGNESNPVTVAVTVKKKEELKSKKITVDLNHKLTEKDAEKAIENGRKLKRAGAKFAWSTEAGGTPDTSKLGKEMPGKVIVTIPTKDPKNPKKTETVVVDVKVTVRDNESPKVAIQQKDGSDYKDINIETESESGGKTFIQVATITTYRGDKNDIKITATDNSGNVTTLTLTPKTPGETEKAPTGTGTTAAPKTFTLDGTTPLDIKPGEYTRTLKAVDPSGNTTQITVKFIVKTQAKKYSNITSTPVTYKMSSGTTHPKPEDGIAQESKNKLPKDATYSWAKEPNWNEPGKDTAAKVRITFADGSTTDVDTKVTVKDDIAPVIENPATNQVKHNDNQMYYQFKVHKGNTFDIEIKSYDNSGKIKSATIPSSFPGHDGNIVIDNKDGNSANNPATIHIKGTAQRTDLNVPENNKWSRILTVTDNAGKQSTLNIQISVYTDAEEHNATASKVDNPKNKDAIKNAIKITKYDNPNTPINKDGITFDVGDIPTKDGNYTIPVTIHYKDGSSSKIEVPIVVTKESNNYDPVGKTITVQWNSKEDLAKKIKSFGKDGGLTWKDNNSPAGAPTVEIVNKNIPSTDKPGESQVQVKVTYSDGSSDVATVTVKVLDPQNKDYTPEGQTIKVDYNKTKNTTIEDSVEKNGIKLKKNGADTTLPTDATVTIDSNNTIPDGTQPGDFTVPVTITYGDGSTDHATVTVKVGEPQNKKYEPNKPDGINVGYGKTKPSHEEITAKVTVPNQPTGTTITVDDGQTPIDTKTPGTVNVKVTVTYPDGSTDHVEVPVTVGEPDNVTHKASATPIELHKGDKNPTEQQIKDKVTTGVGTGEDQPTITVATNNIPKTNQTGTTNVPVTIKYQDGTTTTVQVPVIVKDWNKDEYPPSADPVEEPYGTSKEKTKEAIKNAVNVDLPEDKKNELTFEIVDEKTIPDGTEPGTKPVNVKVTYPDTSTKEVTVYVTIKNKQSDTFEPKVTPVVKPYGTDKEKTKEAVKKAVTVDWPKDSKKQPTVTITSKDDDIPDGKTPGNYPVEVKVTYPDDTTDTVEVPVTISNKQSELYPPKADSITKKNGEAPTAEDIKKAVEIPNWPQGKGQVTKTVDSSSIPDGNKGGTFNVPVTVTYPDTSVAKINVPVNIGNPEAATKVVTVPKGVEPKPEDSIANKDKFPDGTTFEWKKENDKETGKPDTSSEGTGKSGIVVVTVPGQNPVDVPVTVNVVDPGAPQINVLQGKGLPEAEDVIKDSSETNKYPSGTTFTWKPENTPDTSNPGTKSGKIIITIPGQSPVEVSVIVNVLPTPEANVVNVPKDGTLPEAKTVIKDSNDTSKFPEGTNFDWKTKPKTDESGKDKHGTITVTIPGVNGKQGYTADVEVTVNVTPTPNDKVTTVAQNSDPDPKNSIANNGDFPEGTKFEWSKGQDGKPGKSDTSKTGNSIPGTVVITVPGQKPQTVEVKVNVTPAPEVNNITVLQKKSSDTTGKEPNAEDAIANKGNFPKGTTFDWKKDTDGKNGGKPDTSHVGNQPGIVTITVPGMTPVDVPVNVLVVPNPEGKTVSVPVNAKPKPEDSIANNGDFPDGTTFEWEKDAAPKTDKTGPTTGTVIVKIPGLKDPVEVKVTLNVTDKPFINDSSAKNTPENPGKTTITGKTQPGNTVTVKDKDGKTVVGTGTADKDGNFTIEIDKKDPGTTLNLIPSNGKDEGEATTVTVIAKPKAPTITVPSENKDGKPGDGNVTVTPTKDDSATVVTIVITAKPNPLNGPEKPVRTIVVKKGDDGTWKKDGDVPEGVTVDPKTGEVKIPAKDLEDGSTITAVAKDENDNPSDKAEKTTGFKTPQITEQSIADVLKGGGSSEDQGGNNGSQVITGKTDIPGATITVTDNNGKQIGTGVADGDGKFRIEIPKQTPGSIVNLTPTKGTGDFAKTGNTVEVTVGGDIAVPRIDTPADGSATITPNLTDTRIDKVVITYTPEGDGSTPQTVTITVTAEGDMRVWKIDGDAPNGVTVDPKTGVVTIPAANVKDGSKITAFAKNSADSTAGGSSSTVTGTIAQPGDGGSGDSGSGDSGSGDDSGDNGSGESGSHANNANNANNANKNGSNNHGNQSRNSGSNSESRRGKGALGNTGVGVALSALASAMLAGMGAAGRAVSRRKKRN